MTTITPLKVSKKAASPIAGDEFNQNSIFADLTNPNPAVALAMLDQMARAGEPAAIKYGYLPAITAFLANPNPDITAGVFKVFGNCGQTASFAVPQMRDTFVGYQVPTVQAAACEAFCKLGPIAKIASMNLQAAVNADNQSTMIKVIAIKALGAIGSENSQFLLTLLEGTGPDVKCAAVEALGACGEAASVSAKDYEALLSDARTAQGALKALATLGSQAPDNCAAKITECLTSKDFVNIDLAVTAILAGVPVDETKLKGMFKSESPVEKAACAMAVGSMGEKGKSYASEVAGFLEDSAEDESSLGLIMGAGCKRGEAYLRKPKCAALIALGKIGAEAELDKVAMALTDDDWEVRLSALETMGTMSEFSISYANEIGELLADVTYTVRAKAAEVLGAMKAETEVDAIAGLLTDNAVSVKVAAVTALGVIGEAAETYCHEVFKSTSDTSPKVRAAALKTLSLLGDIGCNYAPMIASLISDTEPTVRCEALEALGRMGDFGLAFQDDILAAQEEDEDDEVKVSAGKALMSLGLISVFKEPEEQLEPERAPVAPFIMKMDPPKLKVPPLGARSTDAERAMNFLSQFCADIEDEREKRGVNASKPAFLPF